MRKGCTTLFLFAAKGKDLDHEKSYWDTEDGSDDVADHGWESKQVIKDHNDDILYDIVRYIRYSKF